MELQTLELLQFLERLRQLEEMVAWAQVEREVHRSPVLEREVLEAQAVHHQGQKAETDLQIQSLVFQLTTPEVVVVVAG